MKGNKKYSSCDWKYLKMLKNSCQKYSKKTQEKLALFTACRSLKHEQFHYTRPAVFTLSRPLCSGWSPASKYPWKQDIFSKEKNLLKKILILIWIILFYGTVMELCSRYSSVLRFARDFFKKWQIDSVQTELVGIDPFSTERQERQVRIAKKRSAENFSPPTTRQFGLVRGSLATTPSTARGDMKPGREKKARASK